MGTHGQSRNMNNGITMFTSGGYQMESAMKLREGWIGFPEEAILPRLQIPSLQRCEQPKARDASDPKILNSIHWGRWDPIASEDRAFMW